MTKYGARRLRVDKPLAVCKGEDSKATQTAKETREGGDEKNVPKE